MGIPRFYRYMSERYPLLNEPISDVSLLPEFDAFYLDMNGIIHNCTHSDTATDAILSQQSLEAQLHGIFTYLDRLITHVIKPKQLVYIAIDGVAPRAKLNQQRSRRFRAGLERQAALEQQEKHLQIQAQDEVKRLNGSSLFDSNCITPGTAFLSALSQHLVDFVRRKMKDDPLWARLEVFFSGSEVPGEGEHKIVEFIRHRKMATGYDADVRHCMYGSDADLMLLGLMTHEPHFTLVRETVVWGQQHRQVAAKQIEEQQWQLVHLSLFREYLMLEMRVEAPLEGERMLDDFILLTFLLGNDFIPHSPTLEISEEAIPLLLKVYRKLLETHEGSYLTLNGKLVNAKLLQELFQVIGEEEEDILINRAVAEKQRSGRRGGKKPSVQHDVDAEEVQKAIIALRDDDGVDCPPLLVYDEDRDDEEAERALLEALDGREDTQVLFELEKSDREVLMLVGSESFQETKWNYYEKKYGIKRGNGDAANSDLEHVKKAYMEALVWCLAYYYQGPPSWAWYYPYHYAPMISDLTDIEDLISNATFDEDPSIAGPLLPFEQLMSNLPSSSADLVPKSYRFLMLSPLSPIKHFYPETFVIDTEGKRNAWEGVNLLPFIDVALLKQAIAQYCPDSELTEAERRRNKLQRVPIRIVRDVDALDTLKSSLPGVAGYPDVQYCNTRVEEYYLPGIPGGEFQSKLMDGVVLPLPGFPSLYTVQIESTRTASVGLNCFGMRSRKPSLILQLPASGKLNDGESATADEINPRELLGTTVLANWPNLHEGLVVGISTQSGEYRQKQFSRKRNNYGLKPSEIEFTQYGLDEKSAWKYYVQTEVVKLLSGRGIPGSGGIDLGRAGITVVLHVLPLQGMVSNPLTGGIEKKFGETEAFVPAQLTVRNRKLLDARFEETAMLPLDERFPVGSKVLITQGKWLGCTAVVRAQNEEQHAVTVHVNTIDQEPPFGYVVAQTITDRFFPGYMVAQKLGISASTVGLLTGSVIIKPVGADIGLNIRYRKELLLPGYCRRANHDKNASNCADEVNVWRKGDIVKIVGSSGSDEVGDANTGYGQTKNGSAAIWEYTERAVQLIASYQDKFPEVVRNLGRLPFATTYRAKDVFGIDDSERVEIEIGAVKQWIEQQRLGASEHSKHIPITSEYITAKGVRALEAAGSLRATERAKTETKQRGAPVAMTIKAADLFRPNSLVNQDLTGHEVSQRSSINRGAPILGDRVINISARGVPFGHRGTVVATHVSSKCVEVLFDESFTGGEALYGTTSVDRGKIVAWNSLLCVSAPPGSMKQARNNRTKRGPNGNGQPVNVRNERHASSGDYAVSTNMRTARKPVKAPDKTPATICTPLVAPPVPSAMPAPPDPEKIQQLIEKWSHGSEAAAQRGEKARNIAKTPIVPAAPLPTAGVAPSSMSVEQNLAPSVAAFFTAAAATVSAPSVHAPAAPLMGSSAQMQKQRRSGIPPLLSPPLPIEVPSQFMAPPPPMYYATQPPVPGQKPQLFLMPDGSYAPMYVPQPRVFVPPQPQFPVPPIEEKRPVGAARSFQTHTKPSTTTNTAANGSKFKQSVHAKSKKGTVSKSESTPIPGQVGAQGSQTKWVPKQGSKAKSNGGPQLLLPSQVMRQQKP